MEQTAFFIPLMDLIGTIAFALSGAVLAIGRDMDIFGVNILAIVTATGGGMIRDTLIGKFPPVMFRNPFYVLISSITANCCFVFFFIKARRKVAIPDNMVKVYAKVFFWFDTLGLAAFSVDGVYAVLADIFGGHDRSRRRRAERSAGKSDACHSDTEYLCLRVHCRRACDGTLSGGRSRAEHGDPGGVLYGDSHQVYGAPVQMEPAEGDLRPQIAQACVC